MTLLSIYQNYERGGRQDNTDLKTPSAPQVVEIWKQLLKEGLVLEFSAGICLCLKLRACLDLFVSFRLG